MSLKFNLISIPDINLMQLANPNVIYLDQYALRTILKVGAAAAGIYVFIWGTRKLKSAIKKDKPKPIKEEEVCEAIVETEQPTISDAVEVEDSEMEDID